MSIEKRTYGGLSIRADGDGAGRKISGYAAKFGKKSNNLGGFREIIAPGAFNKAVSNNGSDGNTDVRALKNHDANLVLGRTKAGTLKLSTDSVGLRFECYLPDTGYARDLHESIKRGDIDQCSFAFRAIKDEWQDDPEEFDEASGQPMRLRYLRDVDLFDISAVTYPAYEDTVVSARALEMVGTRRGNPARVIPANLLGGESVHERASQRVFDETERLILLNRMATSQRLWNAQDAVRALRAQEVDNWDQKKFDEIKACLKIVGSQRYSVDDALRAESRLAALLAEAAAA